MASSIAHRSKVAPDHFLSVEAGPPLPKGMEKEKGKHPLFFKPWKFDVPLVKRKSVGSIAPHIGTFEPEYLRFLQSASRIGSETVKADIAPDGTLGPSGWHTTPTSFGTVSGYSMNPMSFFPRKNEFLRSEEGLPNAWRREEDRAIFREWLHEFFGSWYDRPVKARKRSKEGPPYMSYNVNEKIDHVVRRLSDTMFPKILSKLSSRDLRALRKDHQMIFLGVTGRRGQSDSFSKVRMVSDLEYALSNGHKGSRFPADKEVFLHGTTWDLLCAQRARVVMGYSFIPNGIGQMMSTGHLYAAYHNFAPSLKFAKLQDKIDELCETFLPDAPVLQPWAADIANFDQCACPEFMMNDIMDVMGHYWDESMVALQDLLHTAPYCSAPLSLDGEFVITGNPDDLEAFDSTGCLKSGHNQVTIQGIIQVVGNALIVANYAFGGIRGNVKRILEGDYFLRIWDKGDDHVIWGEPHNVDRFASFACATDDKGDSKYSYFKISPELGCIFIGSAIERLGPRRFIERPRMTACFEKEFANEHDAGSIFRPCYASGGFVRKALYGNSNAFALYNDIISQAWEESGAQARWGSLTAIADAAQDNPVNREILALADTAMDLDVLLHEEKLEYRYHDSDISQKVVDYLRIGIPQELTSKWTHKLYGGQIIDPLHERIVV